ncbi:MAG: hypothetical protein HY674_16400, partial [Chloroflexi bacterium]|nr:hypothetical protein [Chloroflexota bacterium]
MKTKNVLTQSIPILDKSINEYEDYQPGGRPRMTYSAPPGCGWLYAAMAVVLMAMVDAAQAAPVVVWDDASSGDQQAYASQVSATDLINNGQNTLSSVSVTGYKPFAEGGFSAADPGSPEFILNDGAHGGNTGNAQSMSGNAAFDTDGTFSVIYYLNTTLSPAGYNLTTIDTFTAHADNRASQKYT